MKVRATHFAEDIAKVNWQGVPAAMKKDGQDLKEVAKFYSDGGDFKAGIDAYVSALNKKLATAKPKPAAKAKPKTAGKPYTESKDMWGNPITKLSNGATVVKFGAKWQIQNPEGLLVEVFDTKEKALARALKIYENALAKKKPAAKRTKQSAATKQKKAAEIAAAKRDVQAMQKQAGLGEFAKFNRSQILEQAQAFHKRRRLSAQMVDQSVDHKKRLSPTPENLVRWMKEPGKFDLIGVDTFEKNNPTADLKIKKEIFWHRLLKK